MKHWYRIEHEVDETARHEALCRFLRRSHLQFESGGGPRKLWDGLRRLGKHDVLYVVMFLDDDERDEVELWLHTH